MSDNKALGLVIVVIIVYVISTLPKGSFPSQLMSYQLTLPQPVQLAVALLILYLLVKEK